MWDVPCTPWVAPDSWPDACTTCTSPTDPQIDSAWALASAWMYRETAYRFPGNCAIEGRVCSECDCYGRCCCYDYVDLQAGLWPIATITSIEGYFDGLVESALTPAKYRYDRPDRLVFLDGYRPPKQSLNTSYGSPYTWKINATIVGSPPLDVLKATELLACEFLTEDTTGSCKLSKRVTTISDQGITIGFDRTPTQITGIYRIDHVVESYKRVKRVPRIISKDVVIWQPVSI